MDINSVVAKYATKTVNGVEFDVEALAGDADFKQLSVNEVTDRIKEEGICVLIPSFGSERNKHLREIVNGLAMKAQMRTLVTGSVKNLYRLRIKPESVMILKQSFRDGTELKSQIQKIKSMGCRVTVLCLLAHSSASLEAFGRENDVNISAIVRADEVI